MSIYMFVNAKRFQSIHLVSPLQYFTCHNSIQVAVALQADLLLLCNPVINYVGSAVQGQANCLSPNNLIFVTATIDTQTLIH